MDVHPSARRHEVADADMAHAITHHVYAADLGGDEDGSPSGVLYLGPDRATRMLEVVVLERDDGTELAIHAMKIRPKYEELLDPKRQKR